MLGSFLLFHYWRAIHFHGEASFRSAIKIHELTCPSFSFLVELSRCLVFSCCLYMPLTLLLQKIKSIQKQKNHTLCSGSMDLFHQILISVPSLKPVQDPALVQGCRGHPVHIWSFWWIRLSLSVENWVPKCDESLKHHCLHWSVWDFENFICTLT